MHEIVCSKFTRTVTRKSIRGFFVSFQLRDERANFPTELQLKVTIIHLYLNTDIAIYDEKIN